MNQALQSNHQEAEEESGRVNELVENYMKKNTELHDIETLIPVRSVRKLKIIVFMLARFSNENKIRNTFICNLFE